MNMQMLLDIGLLYFVKEVKLFISIVLVLDIFLKKLKNLSGIKTQKLTFFEYKQTIQYVCFNFCIRFTDFMLAGKKLTHFTSLFFPYDFEKRTL